MCKHFKKGAHDRKIVVTELNHLTVTSEPSDLAGFPRRHLLLGFLLSAVRLRLSLEDDAFTQREDGLVRPGLAQVTRWCRHVIGILSCRSDMKLKR